MLTAGVGKRYQHRINMFQHRWKKGGKGGGGGGVNGFNIAVQQPGTDVEANVEACSEEKLEGFLESSLHAHKQKERREI